MSKEASDLVSKTLMSGMITQGKQVEAYENALRTYFDNEYVLTVNSATSGLTLAYRLLSYLIDPTDHVKVISTPLTCFATNAAILANHLPIIWADTDPSTGNIDLEDVERKLTPDTRILTFVHWGGNPVDLNRLDELKESYRDKFKKELYVIEDCAHAFGTTYGGVTLGHHGNICVYSTQAIKHLTTGDGGILILPTKEMYDRAKKLRWYGIDRDQRNKGDFRLEADIPEFGYKYHMNDINATIGLANLPHIGRLLEQIRENASYYREHLQSIEGIELLNEHGSPSFWIYSLKVKGVDKSLFIQHMKNHGIVTSQVHARNDRNTCLRSFQTSLPQLDVLEKEIVSIPVGWWVTRKQTKYIVNTIRTFFKKKPNDEPEYEKKCEKKCEKLKESDRDEYRDLLFYLNGFRGRERDFSVKGIYVYKENNVMIGAAKLVIETKCYQSLGHIEDVVVHPDHRGKGVGKEMVTELSTLALKECYKVILSCKEELKEFYEGCGFTTSGVAMEIRRGDRFTGMG